MLENKTKGMAWDSREVIVALEAALPVLENATADPESDDATAKNEEIAEACELVRKALNVDGEVN